MFHPSSVPAATAPAVGTEHPGTTWPQEMTKIFFPFWAGTGSPLGALFVPAYSFASLAFAAATTGEGFGAAAVPVPALLLPEAATAANSATTSPSQPRCRL